MQTPEQRAQIDQAEAARQAALNVQRLRATKQVAYDAITLVAHGGFTVDDASLPLLMALRGSVARLQALED